MKVIEKKISSVIFATTIFLGAGTSFAAEREIVRCTGDLLGAPVFTVTADANDEGVIQSYQLTKYPDNPFYGPFSVAAGRQDVLMYGDTFILTINAGRSGYAHLFAHGSAVVIDVDLFQHPDLATNGALTQYRCEVNRGNENRNTTW